MEEPLNDNFTWTNNCTFTFITLVRSHECLWNPLHPDFYNAIAQKNALKKIVIKMKSDSLSIERASLKLKSIKIIYQEELYKSLLDPNYESSVYWYTCADCFMRNAAQTPVWVSFSNSLTTILFIVTQHVTTHDDVCNVKCKGIQK